MLWAVFCFLNQLRIGKLSQITDSHHAEQNAKDDERASEYESQAELLAQKKDAQQSRNQRLNGIKHRTSGCGDKAKGLIP